MALRSHVRRRRDHFIAGDAYGVEFSSDREAVRRLKITVQQSRRSGTLKIEGKLVGPWVDELERAWRDLIDSAHPKYIQVDLRELTSLDRQGKELLARMLDSGADLIADGPLTRHIIEEIRRDQVRRKKKSKG